jgi:hypothetical protein
LPPDVRAAARALAAGRAGETRAVTPADAEILSRLVDRAMAAHAGFER